ncbi:MAG: aspartate 1-decarboxylase [Legionellaceae bacterium]|nr:aspartate 1-decarboxylase [Legionellaceae bacterium]
MYTRRMLKSKIHRARVTHADLNYEGSITLSPALLEAADLLPNEAVHIWNITAGTRFETYTIEGKPGSSAVCVNGAAARLVAPGDLIIIASFIDIPNAACRAFKQSIVFVDENNQIKAMRPEVAADVACVN